MELQEELISGRRAFDAIRIACRACPGLRKMMRGARMSGVNLLTLYMSTALGVDSPGAASIWNMASRMGDAHAVASHLETYGHICADIARGAEIPTSGRGLVVSKSRDFQASFFHVNDVFVHKWCGGTPNIAAASKVVAHEDSLYITPEVS